MTIDHDKCSLVKILLLTTTLKVTPWEISQGIFIDILTVSPLRDENFPTSKADLELGTNCGKLVTECCAFVASSGVHV